MTCSPTLRRGVAKPKWRNFAAVLCCLWAGVGAVGETQRPPANPNDADVYVRQGIAAMQRGEAAFAEAAFHRALKRNSSNATAQTYLGVIADQKGDLNSAEIFFAAAVRNDPTSPSARNNHGAVLLKLGRTEQAITEFERSLRFNPEQAAAQANLAQIYLSRNAEGDLRKAHDLFARARDIARESDLARAALVCSLRMNDAAVAAVDYDRYALLQTSEPQSAVSSTERLETGNALLQLGLAKEAVGELKSVSNADPQNIEAAVSLARAYMKLTDASAAEQSLQLALAHNKNSAQVYAELAEVYQSSGRIENAIPTMRQAIALDPRKESYRFRYGMMLFNTKAPAAAVTRLKEAVQLFPNSPSLYFALGLAFYGDHRNPEAEEEFDKAIALDNKFAPAYAYRGLLYSDAGKYEEAIAEYEHSLELEPNVAIVDSFIGEAILKQPAGDLVKAERHLLRAIQLDPSYATAGTELAKLRLRQNRPADAVKELERVVRLAGSTPQAHYLLGRAYASLKRREDSQREFEIFQQLDKENKNAEVEARNDLLKRLANVRY